MTSVATLTHFCFSAPDADYDAEVIAAADTGSCAAELARSFVSTGGTVRQVVELLVDTASTSTPRAAMGDHLLSCAVGLLDGSVTPSAELEALCEAEVDGAGSDAVHEALIVGCLIDLAHGRLSDVEGAAQLTQQFAQIAPFVDDNGQATKRGRVLANAMAALGTCGR